MSDFALEVIDLSKRYKDYTAVDNISFRIPKGSVVGLLGPNGAGKTTTIQMLLGITLADSGTIRYFGLDFNTHRQESLSLINFASSFNTLQGRITVRENLNVFAYLYNFPNPKKKIEEMAEKFEMTPYLDKIYWSLSAGQRTRVNLIKALFNDPKLVLMDEPTASLDPDIADKLLGIIEDLKKNTDISILYTSHDMAEVTRICDTVIFLERGKILAEDTPKGLIARISHATLHLIYEGPDAELFEFLKKSKLTYKLPDHNKIVIEVEEKYIPKVIFGVSKAGIFINDIEIKKPTLEDFFLEVARKESSL